MCGSAMRTRPSNAFVVNVNSWDVGGRCRVPQPVSIYESALPRRPQQPARTGKTSDNTKDKCQNMSRRTSLKKAVCAFPILPNATGLRAAIPPVNGSGCTVRHTQNGSGPKQNLTHSEIPINA